MQDILSKEYVYVAGPDGFYLTGGHMRTALSEQVQAAGLNVTLPNRKRSEERAKERGEVPVDTSNMTEHEKRRAGGARIFKGCADSMAESNACIANLENYRGTQRDGGTTFEIGMAYAKGCRIYAYARDKRPLRERFFGGTWTEDTILDRHGKPVPNLDLPFAPSIIGACKIVEGGMTDVLRTYMADLEEEEKQKSMRGYVCKKDEPCVTMPRSTRPIVYVAASDRYDADAPKRYEKMRKALDEAGFDAIFPTDAAPGVPVLQQNGSLYAKAYNLFDHYQQHVRNCDIIFADLENYQDGYEPQDDVAFEAGMAWQLGKQCYAYMDNVDNMNDRVPNLKEESDFRDVNKVRIENFDGPLNLMFGSSYTIFGGGFDEALKQLKEAVK